MSRPPLPHPERSTGREQSGDLADLDYLPLEYADMLALQEQLAVERLGRPLAQGERAGGEADVTRTFMELSALVAHVLAAYQRHYAGEAFISTARAPSSLVRHARRLAYDPDPGLAASGHVVLFAKDEVSGIVEAPLALASVPLGEAKAQDYETRAALAVDSALNELIPVGAQRPVVIADSATQVRLAGVGHGLEAGDRVALIGPVWRGAIVERAVQDPDADATTVTLDRSVGAEIHVSATSSPLLLARPRLALRTFGSDADPALFGPDDVRYSTGTEPAGTIWPKFQYAVSRAGGGDYDSRDVYLDRVVDEGLIDEHVLRGTGTAFEVLSVTAQDVAAVTLHREAEETITLHTVTLTPATGGGFTSTLTPQVVTQYPRTSIAATVTAIRVADGAGTAVSRDAQPVPADWLAGWDTVAALAATEPNPAPLADGPIDLPGPLPSLVPGRPLVFCNLRETVAQVVTVSRAELRSDGTTRVWWTRVTDPPTGGWKMNDLKVLGNVAAVSHGRTVSETLGSSDGVTAFQRFELGEAPLTVLPGAAGGVPEIELRVDGVRWQLVVDFAESGPDDRHFRCLTGEDGASTVVFGDGRNGAVPPSGDGNLRARYRVGRGRSGDVGPGRLSRLKRAHPLLARAVNLTPVAGGAEPAGAEAIRSQATRWIRTFDRAVSVSDLADLALTMPGIARAAARWDETLGAVLVVATASGDAPPDLDAVRAFLDARRDVTVPLARLRGPQRRDLRVEVELEADSAWLVEVVKDSVRAALHGSRPDAPGLFTFAARQLGQPAYLSEVYERLEGLPGVIGVRVTRFESRGGEPVSDFVGAGVDEWLRLLPNALTVTEIGA